MYITHEDPEKYGKCPKCKHPAPFEKLQRDFVSIPDEDPDGPSSDPSETLTPLPPASANTTVEEIALKEAKNRATAPSHRNTERERARARERCSR